MTVDPARIPPNMLKAYRDRRCAILVGAGASKGAGLPLWEELLKRMIAAAKSHGRLSSTQEAEYTALISDSSKYLMAATGLQESLGSYFQEFVREQFIDPKPQPTELHRVLSSMDRIQFILTTNYDTILERQYRTVDPDVAVCSFVDTAEVRNRLSKREFFILKAHGDAAKMSNGLILTDLDYRRILYRERAYQSILSSVFTMFTIVFVGASMRDPEVNLLLHYIADSFDRGAGPIHYALMASDDVTSIEKDRWFRDLNVQLVTISKDNNYAELTEFLQALHAAA